MEQDGELLLADQSREPVRRRDVARRERCEGRRVERFHVALGRDLLTVLVDDEDDLRLSVRLQASDDVLDLMELLVEQNEIGHAVSGQFTRSHLPAAREGPRERHIVRKFEGGADRQSEGEPGDAHPERLQPAGQVERRRLPLDVRIRGDEDFLDGRKGGGLLDPGQEVGDVEVVRPDAAERREGAPEHVVPTAKLVRPFEDVHVERLLDDREEGGIARRVGADHAGVFFRQGMADPARAGARAGLRDRGREGRRVELRGGKEPVRDAPGALRADARQLFERRHEAVERGQRRHSAALGPGGAVVALDVRDLAAEEFHHLLDALIRGDPVPQVLLLECGRVGVRRGRREIAAGRSHALDDDAPAPPHDRDGRVLEDFRDGRLGEALLHEDARRVEDDPNDLSVQRHGGVVQDSAELRVALLDGRAERAGGIGSVERLGDDLEGREADEAGGLVGRRGRILCFGRRTRSAARGGSRRSNCSGGERFLRR